MKIFFRRQLLKAICSVNLYDGDTRKTRQKRKKKKKSFSAKKYIYNFLIFFVFSTEISLLNFLIGSEI